MSGLKGEILSNVALTKAKNLVSLFNMDSGRFTKIGKDEARLCGEVLTV